eukprot:scaffold23376_cov124-Isochrysis_galbana.AAC.5
MEHFTLMQHAAPLPAPLPCCRHGRRHRHLQAQVVALPWPSSLLKQQACVPLLLPSFLSLRRRRRPPAIGHRLRACERCLACYSTRSVRLGLTLAVVSAPLALCVARACFYLPSLFM